MCFPEPFQVGPGIPESCLPLTGDQAVVIKVLQQADFSVGVESGQTIFQGRSRQRKEMVHLDMNPVLPVHTAYESNRGGQFITGFVGKSNDNVKVDRESTGVGGLDCLLYNRDIVAPAQFAQAAG